MAPGVWNCATFASTSARSVRNRRSEVVVTLLQDTSIVFIPGLLCDARLWRDQLLGVSGLAPGIVADVSLDESVEDMASRLLDSAPARFVLVALSMGGYVAFEVMRKAPERVLALALFSTTAAPDSSARTAERERMLSSLEIGRFEGVTSRLLPRLVHADQLPGRVGSELAAMAHRVGREAFVRQQRAILRRPDSRPLLASIATPTLVAVGDSDQLTPPDEAVAIFRALPSPSFHLFHRCGHLPAIENPRETTNVLRNWLASF